MRVYVIVRYLPHPWGGAWGVGEVFASREAAEQYERENKPQRETWLIDERTLRDERNED